MHWYFANNPSPACPTGLGDEDAIRAVWAADAYTPFDGEKTAWHGFDRYDFLMDEQTLAIKPADGERQGLSAKGQRRCIVVVPENAGGRQPLVLAGLLLGPRAADRNRAAPARFPRRLHHGRRQLRPDKKWDAWYAFLTEKHGLSKKPAFIGMSRGGESRITWATAHPDKVSCIYADNPGGNREVFVKLGELASERRASACTSAAASIPSLGKFALAHREHLPAVRRPDHRDDQGGAGHHPHSLRDPKPIADFIEQSVAAAAGAPPAFAGSRFTKILLLQHRELLPRSSREKDLRHLPRAGVSRSATTATTLRPGGVEGSHQRHRAQDGGPGQALGVPGGFVGRDAVVDLALLAKGFHIVTGPVGYNADGPLRRSGTRSTST